jgi:putative ABC transport system permease protein
MSAASSGEHGASWALWLRWSWRDLRARWLQVVAIALVIALGTGSYAGLTSLTRWRRISTDDAYQQLSMYDLRVQLAQGSYVDAGQLLQRVGALDIADDISAMEERLISDIQVDASTADQTILVPGLLYGLDTARGGPHVNGLYAVEGRTITAEDAAEGRAALEANFAEYYALPPSGEIRISGGRTLQYVGHVVTPEYFIVTTEQGGLVAEANFAAVFVPLQTAQALSGESGKVNDLVLTLAPGADREAVRRALEQAFASSGTIGATVMTRDEDPSYRLNDRDIEGDQQVYEILAFLVLAGAVAAAFNLSARIVDAQRREIGIAMALGLQPWRIAIRPMLVGAQVALLGVILGLGVGYFIGQSLVSLARDLQPLPEWKTTFQFDLFASVAAIGFVLPLIATAWPVWRAVRVPPIETLRPAYRSGRGGGLAPLVRKLRIPGNTLQQAPLRNLVRSPRRTLLTGLGIAAALAGLVSFVGMIDSFVATTDRGDSEILGTTPNRIEVRLAGFSPQDGPVIEAVAASGVAQAVEPGLLLDARLLGAGEEVDVQLELLNLDSAIWRPSLIDGQYDRESPGIYVSELAAKDLGLSPGSTISVLHPMLQADGDVTLAQTELPVLGIHPHPFRFEAYMDINQAGVFGLQGLANRVKVVPAPGVSGDEVKQALIDIPGVAAMESVGDIAQAIRDLLDQFVVVLRVIEGAALLIAVLIAFNSASINMDERTREHATMFAFGLPIGTVMRLAVIENLVLGVGSTVLGLAGGWYLLRLIISTRIADTLPDIYIKPTLHETTLLLTVVVGVGCVALAPLLTWRRLARMDVPGALKVVD